MSRIYFDMSLVLEYILPDSPGDFGAILLWVVLILLVILSIIDVRMYLEYRKIPQQREKQQQNLSIKESMNNSDEEKEEAFIDIRNKVDRLIETHNL